MNEQQISNNSEKEEKMIQFVTMTRAEYDKLLENTLKDSENN